MLFWAEHGVKIFRVDNPHTKPLPFWEWMIGEVQDRYPDVIFLAEAFTRPKMMKRLAKVGFTPSYSYFTWRNTKQELTEYLTELTTTEPPLHAAELLREHARHQSVSLQTSGRAGFQVRLCWRRRSPEITASIAASSSARPTPVPGKEEYLNSEKYEIKAWDWDRPGNIRADIALINRLRHEHPALQDFTNLTFYNAWNDNILYYGKATPAKDDFLLFAVNLDPHKAQARDFEVPLWEFGLPDEASIEVEDLVTGARFTWHGKVQHILLDPAIGPMRSGGSSRRRGALMDTTASEARQTAQRASATAPIDRSDRDWYKDAIIYQLHVKAFHDSNGDGIGDFAGLMERLDYIAEPRRQRDLAAALLSVAAARRRLRYLRLPRDQPVLRRHARFPTLRRGGAPARHPRHHRARHQPHLRPASAGSSARGARSPARPRATSTSGATPTSATQGTRIIFIDTEKSNWTWDPVAQAFFWHRFYSHQPDLNFDNPRVLEEVLRVMHFWLDMGVDGLRLDAIPYLIEREGTNNENLPETHDVLKKIRAEIDAHYPDRMLLAEANQWPEDTRPYFGDGDECHMAFHFPLMPRMYMALAQEDRHPITDIIRQTPDIPEACQWAIFLRNHDELTLEMVTAEERDYLWRTYAEDTRARINLGIRRRLAPLMDNDRRKIELMNALLLSMPGTPVLYYGDEIGMGDNYYLGDRDGVRTPMQWSADRNGGFCRANPQALYLPPIQDPIYGYQAVNVEAQQNEPSSLLNWTRRMIGVRKQHKAFGRGTLTFLYPRNRKILAYVRDHEDENILCVANLVAPGAGGGARSFGIPRHGAGRADRRRGLPADRRPPLHADAAGLRLLLVPARRGGRRAALARADARSAAGIRHADGDRRPHRPRARGTRAREPRALRAAGVPAAISAGFPARARRSARASVACIGIDRRRANRAPDRDRGDAARDRSAISSPSPCSGASRTSPSARRSSPTRLPRCATARCSAR